jgi:hypothetical protein
MNTKQMQAALAKVVPTYDVREVTVASEPAEPLLARAGAVLGAAVPVVRASTDTFFSALRTSYRYHEAVRKGQI